MHQLQDLVTITCTLYSPTYVYYTAHLRSRQGAASSTPHMQPSATFLHIVHFVCYRILPLHHFPCTCTTYPFNHTCPFRDNTIRQHSNIPLSISTTAHKSVCAMEITFTSWLGCHTTASHCYSIEGSRTHTIGYILLSHKQAPCSACWWLL